MTRTTAEFLSPTESPTASAFFSFSISMSHESASSALISVLMRQPVAPKLMPDESFQPSSAIFSGQALYGLRTTGAKSPGEPPWQWVVRTEHPPLPMQGGHLRTEESAFSSVHLQWSTRLLTHSHTGIYLSWSVQQALGDLVQHFVVHDHSLRMRTWHGQCNSWQTAHFKPTSACKRKRDFNRNNWRGLK